ncbi:MAG: hypothetical protein COB26_04755 [Piscirickettsiaceae bacterium]|nr:MAG: hypothetical protein COB89_00495 [Piscirickettsiaceae bacterium]PCI70297.1 MAG: hypothetical protein COB26_04755 [Piscirickettsiaceae bacterium]
MKNLNWLLLVTVLFASGCAHLTTEKKLEKLQATQKLYWKSLRWKSYESAASIVRFRNPARKLADFANLSRITVTNYEAGASLPTAEEDVYKTYVQFSYVQNATGRLLQVRHEEIWWYDADTNAWYLDSDMPNFKMN